MNDVNKVFGSIITIYFIITLLGGFFMYCQQGCKCQSKRAKIINRGHFLWFSFIFHLLFWIPTIIAVFMDNYIIFTMTGIIFTIKLCLASRCILEMKLLNKYSIQTKQHIEELINSKPISYIQAECWHDNSLRLASKNNNVNQKYYNSISLLPSRVKQNAQITQIHRHFFQNNAVKSKNSFIPNIPVINGYNTIVTIKQSFTWTLDAQVEIQKMERSIKNMLQSVDQHCTTNVQIKIDKLQNYYFVQGNSVSYNTMKAGIIISLILQFDFMYISALRVKNIYFTVQLGGQYTVTSKNEGENPQISGKYVQQGYKIPNIDQYKRPTNTQLDTIAGPGQVYIKSQVQSQTTHVQKSLPTTTLDEIEAPEPISLYDTYDAKKDSKQSDTMLIEDQVNVPLIKKEELLKSEQNSPVLYC